MLDSGNAALIYRASGTFFITPFGCTIQSFNRKSLHAGLKFI